VTYYKATGFRRKFDIKTFLGNYKFYPSISSIQITFFNSYNKKIIKNCQGLEKYVAS